MSKEEVRPSIEPPSELPTVPAYPNSIQCIERGNCKLPGEAAAPTHSLVLLCDGTKLKDLEDAFDRVFKGKGLRPKMDLSGDDNLKKYHIVVFRAKALSLMSTKSMAQAFGGVHSEASRELFRKCINAMLGVVRAEERRVRDPRYVVLAGFGWVADIALHAFLANGCINGGLATSDAHFMFVKELVGTVNSWETLHHFYSNTMKIDEPKDMDRHRSFRNTHAPHTRICLCWNWQKEDCWNKLNPKKDQAEREKQGIAARIAKRLDLARQLKNTLNVWAFTVYWTGESNVCRLWKPQGHWMAWTITEDPQGKKIPGPSDDCLGPLMAQAGEKVSESEAKECTIRCANSTRMVIPLSGIDGDYLKAVQSGI